MISQAWLKEIARFLTSGVFNTILSYSLYLLLNLFLDYLIAYTLAFVITVFTSYYLHSVFVFREQLSLMKSAKYQVMHVCLYFVSTGTVYILVDRFSATEQLAPVLAVFVVVPLSYVIGRLIIKQPLNAD